MLAHYEQTFCAAVQAVRDQQWVLQTQCLQQATYIIACTPWTMVLLWGTSTRMAVLQETLLVMQHKQHCTACSESGSGGKAAGATAPETPTADTAPYD